MVRSEKPVPFPFSDPSQDISFFKCSLSAPAPGESDSEDKLLSLPLTTMHGLRGCGRKGEKV
jgi:hypothetical protein